MRSLSMVRLTVLFGALLLAYACDDLSVSGGDDDAGVSGDVGGGDAGPGEVYDPVIDDTLEAVNVRMTFGGTNFYDAPWPSDARLTADGTVDLSNFPNTDVPFIQTYQTVIENEVRGFSTLPVVFVGFGTDLVDITWPEPIDTLDVTGAVQLVHLGEGRCGERVPVELSYVSEGDNYTANRVLRASPVVGFPLDPGQPYALLLLRTLGNESGYALAQNAVMRRALAGTIEDPTVNDSFAPLRDCFGQLGLAEGVIAGGTVFTTQDPRAEALVLRDHVRSDAVNAAEVLSFARNDERSAAGYDFWEGQYRTPIYQRGTSPYANDGDGGGLVFTDGVPEVQRYEDVPFSLAWPTTIEGPFPILVWIDGTGAGRYSHIGDPPFLEALARGFAVANFQPQFHDDRATPGSDETLSTFNYFNPESGRTVFLQQAIDTVYFHRLLTEWVDRLEGAPALDTERIVYGGHSQGAIVGAIVAGMDDGFDAFFLNGIGAWLTITIVERKDPFDIAELVANTIDTGGPLDRFHPVVAIAQTGADRVDPANWSPFWRGWDANPSGNHVLMSNGNEDTTTHYTSISGVTLAGHAAPMAPAGWNVDPFGVWDGDSETPPLMGNRTAMDGSPLTIGSYLKDGSGHFTIYRDNRVMEMGADFWLTAIEDEVPTANAP